MAIRTLRRHGPLLALLAGLLGCAGEQPVSDAPPGRRGPAGEAAQCTTDLLLPTRGLYVVSPLNQPIPESVLALPGLEGISIRVSWKALQPTAQEPRFTLIDEQLAAARRFNKKVSLSIEAGTETPSWVYALGARPYIYILDEAGGDQMCERARMPIPWDPVYLDAFKQLVRAAARRFNRSSLLTHVKLTGLGLGQIAQLPHGTVRPLSTGHRPCATIDEVAAWTDVGYSRARMVSTFRDLIDAFAQSFSSHRLAVVIDTQGFPPIDERGQLIRGASYDSDIVPELLQTALQGRETQLLIQSNELTNTTGYPFPIQLAEAVTIGYKMRWAVSGDKTYRMNGGAQESAVAIFDGAVRRSVAARGKYLEVRLEDAQNPQLAASFAGARILLRRGLQGRPALSAPSETAGGS